MNSIIIHILYNGVLVTIKLTKYLVATVGRLTCSIKYQRKKDLVQLSVELKLGSHWMEGDD